MVFRRVDQGEAGGNKKVTSPYGAATALAALTRPADQ